MIPNFSAKRLLAAILLWTSASAALATELVDYIVAVVNDDVILRSELEETYSALARQIASQGSSLPPLATVQSQLLDRMILNRVQVQRAQQAGLRIDDTALNQAMTDIARRNGLSLNEFALALRREGIDYLALRQQVRDEMLISQLRQREVEARIIVSDRDVQLLLDTQDPAENAEFRLAHILIAVPDGASESARAALFAKAEDLVRQARDGADFAQLAILNSNSPLALDGGDLGWRRGDALPTLFADNARQLAVGGVSNVIDGGSGLHIIKLMDKRGGDAAALVRETRARHILLKPNVLRDRVATIEELTALRESVVGGADFGELAREHSEDPGTTNQGGDLGWQPPGTFVPEFQRALDALDIDEISPVFESPFGFHIAQVLERRERDRSGELRRAQARQAIFKRKANEEFETWARRLRDEAYVEIREAPAQD